MPKAKNLIGTRHNMLVVIAEAERAKSGRRMWLCKCDCGNTKVMRGDNLTRDDVVSCGCHGKKARKEAVQTHGEAGNRTYLYTTWADMKQRCYNPNIARAHRYSGRGIKVCDEWKNSYETFKAYVQQNLGERPEGFSLDRIDNNGNYEPGNIRWADVATQHANQERYK